MKPNPGRTQGVLRIMAAASLIVMMIVFAGPVGASPDCTELRCGQAVVDGDYAEWDVPDSFTAWSSSEDFVAYMYRAYNANPPMPQESALFVRYDLPTQTAYVLVLAKPGVPGIKSAPDAWVSISSTAGNINNKVVTGSSGDNGVPPDFAWVGVGYDNDPNHVRGFEASFSLAPTTSKYLGAHLLVYDDGAPQTSGLDGKTVHIKTGCLLGSIGDYVWHDVNRNAKQDEPATEGLAGVDVRLWLQNNGSLTYKGVQTTDANGYYLFTNLNPGTYLVDCDQGDVTLGWTLTTNNDPLNVTLATGENRRDADFGYAEIPNGQVALGDWIWFDKNLDGEQNDGAPSAVGLQCITVWLYQGLAYKGMTTTDTYGWYVFQGLPAGTYSVKVDTADPDWAQVLNYNSATKPCTPPTAPTSLAAAAFQLDDVPIITTATELTYNVPTGYEPRYDFAAGSTPTAVSLQGFGATPLPLMSVEAAVAAAGALVAGALAWRRRRQ